MLPIRLIIFFIVIAFFIFNNPGSAYATCTVGVNFTEGIVGEVPPLRAFGSGVPATINNVEVKKVILEIIHIQTNRAVTNRLEEPVRNGDFGPAELGTFTIPGQYKVLVSAQVTPRGGPTPQCQSGIIYISAAQPTPTLTPIPTLPICTTNGTNCTDNPGICNNGTEACSTSECVSIEGYYSICSGGRTAATPTPTPAPCEPRGLAPGTQRCLDSRCEFIGAPGRGRCERRTVVGPTPTTAPTATLTPMPKTPPCKKFIDKDGNDVTEYVKTNLPTGRLPENYQFKCAEVETALVTIQTDPVRFVKSLMGILLSLAGGVALLFIIGSGYKIMTSQGNQEKLQEARDTITSAIVGLLFIILSMVILEVIGVDILRIPGFSPE